MILQPLGERPTIYTNLHATLTSLVKKYFLNNLVCEDKVQTPFDPKILSSSTQRISQTSISSEGVPTPFESVGSLRSFCHDRLYMNIRSKCLHTNSNIEYGVISSDIQLSNHYAVIYICNQKIRGVVFSKYRSNQLNIS